MSELASGQEGRPRGRRPRAREAGVRIGRLPCGPLNAITDVSGVKVGHRTLMSYDGQVRSGVTAILPNDNPYEERVIGGSFTLNGAGEVSGLVQVHEWGVMETPICLTNTLSVGLVQDAVVQWMVRRHPEIGRRGDVPIPLVGECDDSWLNDIAGGHLKAQHVYEALDRARGGRVREGNVGGGTGMITCDFKAGIGTSSRRFGPPETLYTLGVLVQSNFGVMDDLRIAGVPVGAALERRAGSYPRRRTNYGSIIVVFATDAPLLPKQLERVAKRCALGLGRVGSMAAHGSGEIVLGFSTTNIVPRHPVGWTGSLVYLHDQHTRDLYEAAIEATEEAVVNSLFAAESMSGFLGRFVPALPLDEVVALMGERSSPGA
ncbi:P1 family peptidase [Lujinxingia litoralis]|uniref:DmpA family aminopeptidase n=1 Tax=Lujinxingia litoralis TaxID=2211119 RepID=UPI0018F74641|nr:P1 family peptidase [Lujinxingia litoralis]